jgi:hypothetical protein
VTVKVKRSSSPGAPIEADVLVAALTRSSLVVTAVRGYASALAIKALSIADSTLFA